MSGNYGLAPNWQAGTQYVAGQDMVAAGNGFYYLCTSNGTSNSSAPTWPTVFNASVSDYATSWVCVGHARAAWAASTNYVAGMPVTTTGTFSTTSSSITNVPPVQANSVGIGAYVVSSAVTFGAQVTNVNASASVVAMSASATTSTTIGVTFDSAPYPWPDQIITASVSGSPVVQALVTGKSGSVQPTWPTTIGASVSDGTVTWITVGTY